MPYPRPSATRRRPRALTICAVALATAVLPAAHADTELLVYDAGIRWLRAGTLTVAIRQDGERYETWGTVRTSAALRPFFSWAGRFSGLGLIYRGQPVTRSYLLIEDELDDDKRPQRRVVLLDRERLAIHSRNGEFVESEPPSGVDIVSALFVTNGCFTGHEVHDGEDTYAVELTGREAAFLRQGPAYYTGDTEVCDYRTTSKRGRSRRLRVWRAPVEGVARPVRIQVRIPALPDGFLRLRIGAA